MFFILAILFILVYLLFHFLLKQSKRPSGFVGIWMMKLWNKVYLPMTKWCLQFLEEKEVPHVLDIGVGNGQSTQYIATNLTCTSLIGIDISEVAIEQAIARNSKSTIRFEVKNICQTQYPNHYFDLVCAFQSHFHWNDLDASFLEISRVLANTGHFVIGCEYSKIKYFLPDLKKDADFSLYLQRFNLRLAQIEQRKDWIFYKIIHS